MLNFSMSLLRDSVLRALCQKWRNC